MSVVLLLDELASLRIDLRVEEGKLRYKAPEGALSSELRERMSAKKDALLALLGGHPLPEQELLRFPASDEQQRIWFFNQLQGPNCTYNIPLMLRLQGSLDMAALKAALETLVRRHQSLRSSFYHDGTSLHMEVRRDCKAPWAEKDFSELNAEDREKRLHEHGREFIAQCFDLGKCPLMNACLVRLGSQEHALLMNFHHIISDGWSFGVILQELATAYSTRHAGRETATPALSWQYSDYIAWMSQLREKGAMDADLQYWRTRLAGAPANSTLPEDLPRPPVQKFSGDAVLLEINAARTTRLRQRAREWSASINHLTLAASAILLASLKGSHDIVIGMPLANRVRRELEPIIGMFVNVVPLRIQLPAHQTPAELVGQVKHVCSEAMVHCNLPLHHLVQELVSKRDLSMSPLFQVVYNFLPHMDSHPNFADLKVDASDGFEKIGIAKNDATIYLDEQKDTVLGYIEYSDSLYRRETVERWVQVYLDIIDAMLEQPKLAWDENPQLKLKGLAQVDSWYQGEQKPLRADSPWARFEEQMKLHPDAVACEDEGALLSYSELARRAGVISALLANQGVGRGDRVGLLLPRGADYVAAMLGVVRRGAVFVPFDCSQPAERLSKMCSKARLSTLLHRPDHAQAPSLTRQTLVIEPGTWLKPSEVPAPVHIAHDDPLYMIFTSGSSGMPKAVCVPWRGLCNIVQAYSQIWSLGEGERFSQLASTSFDASLIELWPSMLNGGTLVIVPEEKKLDSEALKQWVIEKKITVHFSPTPLAEELLGLDWPEKSSLRILFTGGQTLHKFPRPGLSFRFSNNYGPTEASIAVTSTFVEPSEQSGGLPRIGRVIPNMQLAILDEAGHRVAPNQEGELHLSGLGLALEYFDEPELTARSFVSLREVPGAKWYRTGDKVRMLAGGDLEFLGRLDSQIKLRGHRIELGEIEQALLQLPGIRQAVVRLETEQLIAYLEADRRLLQVEALRAKLTQVLPAPMIPSHFVVHDRLPRQSSGKIDIKTLPFFSPGPSVAATPARRHRSGHELEAGIALAWAKVLNHPAPGLRDNFFELGGHSMMLMRLREQIKTETKREISVLELFRNPSIEKQAAFLEGGSTVQGDVIPTRNKPLGSEAIAIIGMSGRFPDADSIESFWENLRTGRDSVRLFSREELLAAGLSADLIESPDYVPANAILKDIGHFDAEFFGIPAREAEIVDPQQRLLLEEAWHAFEDAAYDPAKIEGRVGVFVGSSMNGYVIENVMPRRDIMDSVGYFAVMIANDKDFSATRISYKLGLRGPSLSINTACSTSLVAIHQAVTALRDGQCELALAGGACVRSQQIDGYTYEEGGVLSRDGKCRAFDAESTGMVGGSGVALVLLKPLADALEDKDHIYAVIKGIAVNNDSSDKVGFTAPGIRGQSLVIRDALERAAVDPNTVLYAEAHGTATQLGDSIELAALAENYAPQNQRSAPLLLGSVKTNIGHLDAAAGAAGLIKTALCLQHRTLVPSLHFRSRNPHIQWPGEHFSVSTQTRPWISRETPLRASVSSFGIGGTNAHAILEEVAPRTRTSEGRRDTPALLLLSGRNEKALQANASMLADWLCKHTTTPLCDVAHTLAFGRRHWSPRRAVCAGSSAEATELLSEPGLPMAEAEGVAFLFTGMGTQKPGMARALYERAPVFKACIDECAEHLLSALKLDLRSLLLASAQDQEATRLLQEHRVGQVAVFAVEYASARFWISLGLKPSVLIGHSLGEWVAACVAGVFTLPDALRLVAYRGALMDHQRKGGMLAVNLSEKELLERLPAGLDIATINAVDQIVVAGPEHEISSFALRLEEDLVRCKRLDITLAAHSSLMEPALELLRAAVAKVTRHAPNSAMDIISNLTGRYIEPDQLQSPDYWAQHLRGCVRFADGIATLWARPGLAMLECGPSHTLCKLALNSLQKTEERAIVATIDGEGDAEADWRRTLESAGNLWAVGLPIDLEQLFALQPSGLRIPLPGYAFQRKRYWLDTAPAPTTAPVNIPTQLSKHEHPDDMAPAAISPCNTREQGLIAIMKELLGRVQLGRTSDFFLAGGDSLMAIRLAARIKDLFGVRLTRTQIMKAKTPARIALLLDEYSENEAPAPAAEDATDDCLVLLQQGDQRLAPIVLVHAIGGGIYIYGDFLKALASSHPVYGLQSPGLWDDAAPIADLREQARHYHASLLKAGITRPLMLGGCSYGGLLCYELDRLYQELGHHTPVVLLFDSPGPGYLPQRLNSEAEHCAYLLQGDSDHRNFQQDLTRMKALSHEQRLELVLEKLRASIMPDATSEDLTRLLRVLGQNLTNLWDWSPQPHQARLLYCKATEPSALLSENHELAWVRLAKAGMEIVPVPGNHSSMLSFPHATILAKEVNRRLSAQLHS